MQNSVKNGSKVQIEFETNIEDGLIFESFDENYATVDQNGLVTSIKKGTARQQFESGVSGLS